MNDKALVWILWKLGELEARANGMAANASIGTVASEVRNVMSSWRVDRNTPDEIKDALRVHLPNT